MGGSSRFDCFSMLRNNYAWPLGYRFDELMHNVEHVMPCVVPAGANKGKREESNLRVVNGDNVDGVRASPSDGCKLVAHFAHCRMQRRDEARMERTR